MYQENRFKMLTLSNPAAAKELVQQAQNDVNTRWQMYQYLAARSLGANGHGAKDPLVQAVTQAMS
jgi:pyruvate-ferredoxin/flavodoxin oxidoreductase